MTILLICDKNVTTQNLAFLSYLYKKKRLQMHFEQVECHSAVCKTHRWRAVVSSLHSQHLKTFKLFSWRITDFVWWHCCRKWAIYYH